MKVYLAFGLTEVVIMESMRISCIRYSIALKMYIFVERKKECVIINVFSSLENKLFLMCAWEKP